MSSLFEALTLFINYFFWMIRVSLNFIWPPLNKVEQILIIELREVLKGEHLETFDKQIESANVFRRFDTGDISLYFCHWSLLHLKFKYTGKYFFSRTKMYEKLLYFNINPANGAPINCTLNATNGVISHINMHQPKISYNQLLKMKFDITVQKGRIAKKT